MVALILFCAVLLLLHAYAAWGAHRAYLSACAYVALAATVDFMCRVEEAVYGDAVPLDHLGD